MKENQEYVRKRRPINFTLPELEKEIDEENEGSDYQILDPTPGTSRSLPMRSCKEGTVHYDDSSSSDDDIYDYPEDHADMNFEQSEQPNLNQESTKNSIENEKIQPKPYYGENSDEDSDPYGYRAELLGHNGQNTSSDDDY